jgi:glycosyltransferase involved in cell wall biosynthesis
MYRGRVISTVVPAFQEEVLIAETIGGIPEYVDHILVVDDASPDRTSEVARGVGDPRVEVLRLAQNQGVGGAIITGHRRALELGSDINVVMAGDNQMDPAGMPLLLDPIIDDGYGYTKGSRFFSPTSMEGMPAIRVIGNMGLTFLNKAASGYWNLVDPQNGYTAITRESLELIPLDRVSKRYEFENDLLIWLNIANVRARDVNIAARYGTEVSSISLRSFAPRITGLLVRGFWRRMWLKHMLWSFSPIALMFFAGLTSLVFGIAVGLWVTAVAIGGQSPTAGTTVLAVVPFFCGFIMLVQALVLDILATPD